MATLKPLEEAFQQFRRAAYPPDVPAEQINFARAVFFSGACALSKIIDETPINDMGPLVLADEELEAFSLDMQSKGRLAHAEMKGNA